MEKTKQQTQSQKPTEKTHPRFDKFWTFSNKSSSINYCLSLLFVIICQENLVACDYECGINRFNNESPLTERIVGGNNSLQ